MDASAFRHRSGDCAVGIGSTIATAVAAVYAGQQAELSKKALSAKEENAAFFGAFGSGVKAPAVVPGFVETAGNCIGVRKVQMAWYRDWSGWRIESASRGVDLKVVAKPLY